MLTFLLITHRIGEYTNFAKKNIMKTQPKSPKKFQQFFLLLLVFVTVTSCSKVENSDENSLASIKENFKYSYFDAPGLEFSNEELPVSNSTELKIQQVQSSNINSVGESGPITIIALGEPTKLIIGVKGVKGFFYAPFNDLDINDTNAESLAASINLLIGQQASSTFTIALAVGDAHGNFSNYHYLPISINGSEPRPTSN